MSDGQKWVELSTLADGAEFKLSLRTNAVWSKSRNQFGISGGRARIYCCGVDYFENVDIATLVYPVSTPIATETGASAEDSLTLTLCEYDLLRVTLEALEEQRDISAEVRGVLVPLLAKVKKMRE